VLCFAIAASTSKARGEKPSGDGLVPVASALGLHEKTEMTLQFPESHKWIAYGTNHLDLLNRAEVYAQLRSWLAG
jgi:hypothetical protein